MARVLVTGGAGLIGSHLVREMLDAGHNVLALDAFTQYRMPTVNEDAGYNFDYRMNKLLAGAQVLRGNVCDKDHLRRQFVSFQPDCVVHFAAMPLADMAIEFSEEALGCIINGTVNLLEIARDMPAIRRFVYISSSMVYGDFERDPIPEDATTSPKEIYGGMKLAGEQLVKVYSQRYDIPFTIVRPSAVYGPSDNNRRVLHTFLMNAIQGHKLRVKNAETTRLDFSYVKDVALGIRLAALSPRGRGEIFNITRGEGRTLEEAVRIIRCLYPSTSIEYVTGSSFRPRRGALDISKARRLLGYAPMVNLEDGINRYAQYIESNPAFSASTVTRQLRIAA